MEIVPWVLAAALAVLVIVLAMRSPKNPYPAAIERMKREVEGERELATTVADDPPEVAALRQALAKERNALATVETKEPGKDSGKDPGDQALRGIFRYMELSVLTPLNAALTGGGDARGQVEDAIDALQDLAFYSREVTKEPLRTENLAAIVQSVTREYGLETGVPIVFTGPETPVMVQVGTEGFKDALYLLLSNAERYGGGKPIDVVVETEGEKVRLSIRDQGPGLTPEALDHAMEPFWTSDPDALGLGLPHARRILEAQGARLGVRNLGEGGGAEAVITLRRGSRS